MLIEQSIVFELMGPRPSGRTCIPTTGYFHDKTKISKEYLRVDFFIIYCYIITEGNVTYFPLPGPNHFKNLTPKCWMIKCFGLT